MGLTNEQRLQRIRDVVAEIERLQLMRDDFILDAAEAEDPKIPRQDIADAAGLTPPMIYKIRRAAEARRDGN